MIIELNENITSETATEIFANVGLTETITHHYCDTGLVPTHKRGSHHIDGIYTSINIKFSAVGYIPFGTIPSDHHLLWLKIDFDSEFGTKMDTLVPHTVRRLN